MELKLKDLNNKKDFWEAFSRPFFVAGPCSVESPEQVKKVAEELSKNEKVKALRGGIWKPRTRPNSFEGVGAIGLPWLVEAGKENNLPTMVEVANASHVDSALKAGVDILWVGARTSVNPFSVQEIADALRGVDVPVLVKNPISPDLQLWLGAIERVAKAGISKVAAVHRGFNTYQKTLYRNDPMWEIPIDLKTYLPDIKLICDPSHIGGKRDMLLPIAQRALDLNFDGIMIETHPDPDKAWSDAEQQITPSNFNKLTEQLILRQEKSDSTSFKSKLELLRHQIDEIDDALVIKIFERLKLVEQIGVYKKENNVTILQLERWQQILDRQLSNADRSNLDKPFIRHLFQVLHDESIRIQTEIMNGK
jgi:chorismate mutase